MRKHVYGLHGGYGVFDVEQLQVASLCGRIATNVNDALGLCTQYDVCHILVHSGTRRVGDDYVRPSVRGYKVVVQNIFHVAGKEQRVLNAVDFGVHLGVFDGLGNVLNADDLTCFAGHEISDGAVPVYRSYTSSVPVSSANRRATL